MGLGRLLIPGALAVVCVVLHGVCPVRSQGQQFWNDQAQLTLEKALHRQRTLNTNTAKNVVFFVGDGMGISTVTAARILKGQNMGYPGEETVLAWEKFSSLALAKTYSVDGQVSDSASTATAFFCGVKSRDDIIGLDDRSKLGDCASTLNSSVESFLTLAHKAGKATGFVTTSRVTHATPAALYAHCPDRYWEDDEDVPPEERALGCTDIGSQLAENGKDFEVILGGGRRELTSRDFIDPEYPEKDGHREDGRNIINEWLLSKPTDRSKYVWNLDDFNNVDPSETDHLIGLFERSHMHYEIDRLDDEAGEPSLAEMVEKAIKILQKDPDGFVLAVEGARIDHAHHGGTARLALLETLAMEAAVAKAMELTNEEDTLVIVTADHSHTLTIGSYPRRGNPILGLYGNEAEDGLPTTTLLYADGPGGLLEMESYNRTGARRNLNHEDTEHLDFAQPAIIPMDDESHAGEDVAIYANGPMSHLFHSTHEQHYIAHVVKYAACLNSQGHCKTSNAPPCKKLSPAYLALSSVLVVAFFSI
ncbi:alkaline phosphatase-like isoform X2 [Acanthaster planci]|uniref:Alkaline phosphatase n=2 Tax=Acanthaster planci TaxID=133434 RepID=A0A8B7ZLH2_ACAPL|nr:alkaline phosphatase-like isoform X2 [Acanthaster planci]